MDAVIDTTALVDAERRGNFEALSRVPGVSGRLFVSLISIAELQVGVEYAPSPRVREGREAFVQFVLNSFLVESIDKRVALEAGRVMHALESTGRRIGPHDSWIAAYALCLCVPVVTHNVEHFRRVDGLAVLPWRP